MAAGLALGLITLLSMLIHPSIIITLARSAYPILSLFLLINTGYTWYNMAP